MICEKPLEAVINEFQLDQSGFICPDCRRISASSRSVSVDIQKVIRMIDRGDVGNFLRIKVPGSVLQGASQLITDIVSNTTGRESTATRVVRDLRLEYAYRDDTVESEDDDGLS